MVYIRQQALPRLKEYKYSGVDHSLLSRYLLKPFYTNVAIHAFPLSMAPNAITLSGFGFVVVNFLTMLWYSPTLDQDCPSWVYVSWAVGLFLYQTFDAVDGTQARRTRQSGPLGELFDHGVDALNTALEVLLFAAAMNLGQSWLTVLTLFGCILTFYVQTWEEYHTHTLTLGLVSGPVEGILTLCIVFALTAFLGGGSFWQQSAMQSLGLPKPDFLPETAYDLAWNQWFMVYAAFILFFNTAQSTLSAMNARKERDEDPSEALKGYLPFIATWVLIPAYLKLQPNVLHNHLVPFIIYVGLINAYSVGQMIVAHLTKSPFPYQNILILPLLFGVLDSSGPQLAASFGVGWPTLLGDGMYQVAFLFMSLGLAIGVYGSFVVDVIVAICDYLDIWCLKIKHPYVAEAEQSNDKKKL